MTRNKEIDRKIAAEKRLLAMKSKRFMVWKKAKLEQFNQRLRNRRAPEAATSKAL